MAAPISAAFIGGTTGPWRVLHMAAVRGEPLARVSALRVSESSRSTPPEAPAPPRGNLGSARPTPPSALATATWILRGTTGHVRYVEQREKVALAAVSPALGRPEATRAALIPIRKNDAWWELAQDERRALLEQKSQHITLGMKYLPAIARRLYHSRELGEPFDFVTWFEYAPADSDAFEDLVARLRSSEEWRYVEREIDLRLERT